MTNSNANKPILAVTANALSGDKERCLAVGMNDYINKPLKLNVIKESLEQWLPTEKVSKCRSIS
jgi:CheY-like chemotaxis protein